MQYTMGSVMAVIIYISILRIINWVKKLYLKTKLNVENASLI